jgi:hypothetical protein
VTALGVLVLLVLGAAAFYVVIQRQAQGRHRAGVLARVMQREQKRIAIEERDRILEEPRSAADFLAIAGMGAAYEFAARRGWQRERGRLRATLAEEIALYDDRADTDQAWANRIELIRKVLDGDGRTAA